MIFALPSAHYYTCLPELSSRHLQAFPGVVAPGSYRWPPYLATQSVLPCTEGTGCARFTTFRFLAVGL